MTARQFIRGQLPKPTVSATAGYGGGGQKNNREAGGLLLSDRSVWRAWLNDSRPVGEPSSVETKRYAHGKFNDR
jgi:hypothetical protein